MREMSNFMKNPSSGTRVFFPVLADGGGEENRRFFFAISGDAPPQGIIAFCFVDVMLSLFLVSNV